MLLKLCFVFAVLISGGECARILGVFGHPGKSHFDVFQVLMEELARKGHSVTVLSFYPHSNPPKGYVDVSLVGLHPPFVHVIPFDLFEIDPPPFIKWFTEFYWLSRMGLDACKAILPSPQVQKILAEPGQFDIVITEQFNTDCFLAIPYKLQVPFIAMSSCYPLPWLYRRMGLPNDPAVVPNVFIGRSTTMGFLDRLQNTIFTAITSLLYYPLFVRPAQQLVEQHIGEVPPLEEIAKNTSLMLLNTHFTLQQVTPLVPGVVEVGPLHIRPAKPLPQDLEEFISESEHGVILFSLGSMLDPDTFPQEKIDVFTQVFAQLPQRVLWKFSRNVSVSQNVKISNWIPQRDILEHKNVIGFIAHGGLLGLSEAVHTGTPVVAIPMFGDQPSNVKAGVAAGIAVELPYTSITKETVKSALDQILSDKWQKKAASKCAEFRSRPTPPLDLAVYWVEYILKHGPESLRPASVDLNFLQYSLLDVYVAILVILVLSLLTIRTLARLVCRKWQNKIKKE